jgi:hypothetical protein
MWMRGDQVRHFDVNGVDGTRVEYAAIWQRQNLLLVSLPDLTAPDAAAFLSALADRSADIDAYDVRTVVTTDDLEGVARPGVVVADRWGEIKFAAGAPSAAELPSVDELVEWVRFVQCACPECEGEAW